jgi:Flp pilus assembly protein TadD
MHEASSQAQREPHEVARAPVSNDNEDLRASALRLQKQKNFEGAAQTWRQLIQKNPKDAEAMNELGSALSCLGRFEEGLQWFRRALQLKPNLRGAETNAGVALRHLGRFDEAISLLKTATGTGLRY